MASIKIKQHDIKDCGAACLVSIGNHYKVNLPIAKVRQFANTDTRGTNVLGVIEAAQKMGFTAKGVKGMTLTTRYIIARRSLYNLLFDKMDDWLSQKKLDK